MRLHGLASVGLLGLAITTTAVAGPGQPASANRSVPAPHVVSSTALRSLPVARKETSGGTGGGGAVVLKGLPCGIPAPGGTIISTPVSHSVATPSGNVATSCHARTAITPPQAIVVMDAPCATVNGTGADSHLVLTPSGRLNFWCHKHR